MANPPNTFIKVRAQARGGKFLGPKVTAPTLVVTGNGQQLFSGTFDNSASGTVVATPDRNASRNAIVVAPFNPAEAYPAAGAYWVEPPSTGAVLTAGFYLSEATLLQFVATAYAPSPVTAVATMWMNPGMNLDADPGLVLTQAAETNVGIATGTVSAS